MNVPKPQADHDQIEELARLLPVPVERDLPAGRRRPLKEFLMTEIHQDAQPAGPKWRLPRPALLVPLLAVAAAVAVAAPPALGGGAAHAVSKNDDGTIFITINEARDPKSLQADLRDMGLNAVVDYIPRGKKCSPQPRSQSFLPKEEPSLTVWPGPETQESGFTIDPRAVGDGQVAVLEFSVSEQPRMAVAGIWARVSNGPVADCVLVDSTEAPLGPPKGD
ncbi:MULTISPECIES: hypothetical protein [unclassified Streptosporangium]|uniref:hypothetical protein n=1 Tax=unclassified Streptosporangium TaxID=2632669 RepID=UPI002E288C08|nr:MULTISPECIES: hypothetical protein [unclassified Streptosporangium]